MRECIDQLDLLDEKIDVEKVPISICTKTLTEFLLNITYSLFNDKLISDDYFEYADTALKYAKKFFEKGVGDSKTLKKYQRK